MPEPRRPAPASSLSRRRFLGTAAGTAAAAGALPLLAPGMADALAEPAGRGSLDSVEHVVILMQENRSFDHYYGTMRGVRGFGDRAAVRWAPAHDVFHQPDPARTDGGYLLPFHVDTRKVRRPGPRRPGPQLGRHARGRTNGGAYDRWIAAKSRA